MKCFILYFSILFAIQDAGAIINGTEIQSHDPSPFVGMEFQVSGTYGSDLCSGTYLGNGKIITAAHCFLLNEYPAEKIQICFTDLSKKLNLCLPDSTFAVSFPPVIEWGGKAPTRKSHKVIQIPRPDMALLQINPTEISKFEFLKPANIWNGIQPLEKTTIVGQGCTNYASFGEAMIGQGTFRSGDVILSSQLETTEWSSVWTVDSKNSGVCWGDSGGALLGFANGESYLSGIISGMRTKHDPTTGAPAIVTSRYGRLDHPEIQKWLKQNGINYLVQPLQ